MAPSGPSPVRGALLPAAGEIYLGARVNPSGGLYDQANVSQFEAQIGRTLALDNHYHGWTTAWPDAEEADDLANHRIPVVAWNCGVSDYDVAMAGSGGPNAAVINAQIDSTATAVKAFGSPIMIRWFWEMNLSTADVNRGGCWDSAHDFSVGSSEYFNPKWYAAAFDYIEARFKADGATNAVWVWCPSAGGQPIAAYYPGNASVDWLSFDNYALSASESLTATMQSTYSQLTAVNAGKPILVAESATLTPNQPSWLSGAAATLRTAFPNIKGFMYFDATGPRANWALSTVGSGSGLDLFTRLAKTTYMSAR